MFIDTFTAVPNRLFPPQHVAVVVFIYWIPYHQQNLFIFCFNSSFTTKRAAAVAETSSKMSHLAPKQVGEDKRRFKPKFNIRMNFCQMNFCLLRKIKDPSRTCRRYSQSRKDKGSENWEYDQWLWRIQSQHPLQTVSLAAPRCSRGAQPHQKPKPEPPQLQPGPPCSGGNTEIQVSAEGSCWV